MTHDFPPEYVALTARLSEALRAAVERGRAPRFRLPPRDVWFVATLDEAEAHVCVNDDARALVPALMHATGGHATCMMLAAALDYVGVAYETATLDEMGLVQVEGGKYGPRR